MKPSAALTPDPRPGADRLQRLSADRNMTVGYHPFEYTEAVFLSRSYVVMTPPAHGSWEGLEAIVAVGHNRGKAAWRFARRHALLLKRSEAPRFLEYDGCVARGSAH